MSEHFIYHFDFGLSPSAPPGVLRAFQALARDDLPDPVDLEAFRASRFLGKDEMTSFTGAVGSPVLVYETGFEPKETYGRYETPAPTHGVCFRYWMSDHGYLGGDAILPFLLFDLVHDHGLFGTKIDEANRSRLDLFFKEFDDFIIQTLEIPSMAHTLPPDAAENRDGYLRGWQAASPDGFKLGAFMRFSPAEREEAIACAEQD